MARLVHQALVNSPLKQTLLLGYIRIVKTSVLCGYSNLLSLSSCTCVVLTQNLEKKNFLCDFLYISIT